MARGYTQSQSAINKASAEAYSFELRQGVVRAYEQCRRTVSEIAEQFSVSPGFVKKMLR
jgi:transposase-like protein